MASGYCRRILAALLCLLVHAEAVAAVEVAFYSREMSRRDFPHAFVRITGTPDGGGEPIDETYGFTARSIGPGILMGSVSGEVRPEPVRAMERSQIQFAVAASDEQYAALIATVERWRTRNQPAYNLNRRNCVHFVADLAAALGLRTDGAEGLMKRPRVFLEHVRRLNPGLINAP
jgi:hypothetical protein